MLTKKTFRALYAVVSRRFKESHLFSYGAYDETFFTSRVFECAKEILKGVKGVDRDAVLVATILHDAGKSVLDQRKLQGKRQPRTGKKRGREWRKHPELCIPIAKRICRQQGFDKDFTERVCYLVANHDNRRMTGKTLELKILQDADLLSDAGFAGAIRPFLYAGAYKRSTIETILYLAKTPNRIQVRCQLNLAISRRIARRLIKDECLMQAELASLISKDLVDTKFTRKTGPR